jgi:hypothetical protein
VSEQKPLKLTDLHPQFLGGTGDGREGVGIGFDCPCGGAECGQLYVPFANPLDGGPQYGPQGWKRTGETFETLTLEPSILRKSTPCGWHGFIRNGEIVHA